MRFEVQVRSTGCGRAIRVSKPCVEVLRGKQKQRKEGGCSDLMVSLRNLEKQTCPERGD